MQMYVNYYLNWKKDGILESGNICWVVNMLGGFFGIRFKSEE